MNIKEFCDKHNAGSEVREWALANCNTMQEAWDKCPNVNWMIWMATRPNVLDGRSLRLFTIWCCRQVHHLMRDQRSIAAIDAAEQFANGLISPEQLAKVHQLTYTVAADAAAYAAYAAAYAADARAADAAVAAYAAAADVHKAAESKQMEYLRQNTKPNFE